MIAELSSNTYQTYPPFYDQTAVGWCVPQKPELTLNNDPLNLIKANSISRPIIQLSRSR
jgi:hypothetical protein